MKSGLGGNDGCEENAEGVGVVPNAEGEETCAPNPPPVGADAPNGDELLLFCPNTLVDALPRGPKTEDVVVFAGTVPNTEDPPNADKVDGCCAPRAEGCPNTDVAPWAGAPNADVVLPCAGAPNADVTALPNADGCPNTDPPEGAAGAAAPKAEGCPNTEPPEDAAGVLVAAAPKADGWPKTDPPEGAAAAPAPKADGCPENAENPPPPPPEDGVVLLPNADAPVPANALNAPPPNAPEAGLIIDESGWVGWPNAEVVAGVDENAVCPKEGCPNFPKADAGAGAPKAEVVPLAPPNAELAPNAEGCPNADAGALVELPNTDVSAACASGAKYCRCACSYACVMFAMALV